MRFNCANQCNQQINHCKTSEMFNKALLLKRLVCDYWFIRSRSTKLSFIFIFCFVFVDRNRVVFEFSPHFLFSAGYHPICISFETFPTIWVNIAQVWNLTREVLTSLQICRPPGFWSLNSDQFKQKIFTETLPLEMLRLHLSWIIASN